MSPRDPTAPFCSTASGVSTDRPPPRSIVRNIRGDGPRVQERGANSGDRKSIDANLPEAGRRQGRRGREAGKDKRCFQASTWGGEDERQGIGVKGKGEGRIVGEGVSPSVSKEEMLGVGEEDERLVVREEVI